MKLKKENVIMCQAYEAPKAECFRIANEGVLCGSSTPVEFGSTINRFGEGGSL